MNHLTLKCSRTVISFLLIVNLQVTCEYHMEKGACVPLRVHTIVVSVQHSEEVTPEQMQKDLMDKVVASVIPAKYLDKDTIYHLNPSGRFVIGGPQVRISVDFTKYSLQVITVSMQMWLSLSGKFRAGVFEKCTISVVKEWCPKRAVLGGTWACPLKFF